jgi:hypothetical protein
MHVGNVGIVQEIECGFGEMGWRVILKTKGG